LHVSYIATLLVIVCKIMLNTQSCVSN